MKLSSLIDPDLVFPGAKVATKAEALSLMIDHLFKEYSFELTKAEISEMLDARDRLGGTTMPSGLSVLHARLDGFKDLIIGICVPERAIPVDGIQVRMFILILTGKSQSAFYLNTLAALVTISRNEPGFSELLAQADASGFLEALKRNDIAVKKELTVADIMAKTIVSVTPETSIRELIDLFSSHQYSYAPVIDAAGLFIGEVNIRDTLRLGIPEYATMVGSLKFLSTFEPLEELLKNEDALKVERIMKKPSIVFTPDTSIIEAVLEMSQNKRRHIAVVQDKRVIGVVSLMDILNKVLRG